MSGFKEPQPRKNSAADDAKTVIGGNWPPYAREGGEANWGLKPEPLTAPEDTPRTSPKAPIRDTPIMVLPDYSPFELRKAALEAACAIQGDSHNSVFWTNLNTFETYLRDGTKPS